MSEQNDVATIVLSDATQAFISGYAPQQSNGMDSSLIEAAIDFLDGEELFLEDAARISEDGAMAVVDALSFPIAINKFYIENHQAILKYGKAAAPRFGCEGFVGIISSQSFAKGKSFDKLTNALYDVEDDGAERYDPFVTEVRCAAICVVIDDMCTAYVDMVAQQGM